MARRKFSRPEATAGAKTLYDLLGVRRHDDAERLKEAFRKAVKAAHPDTQADDPDAAEQFILVVEAYATLRNPERRAAYDRLLDFERGKLRATWRRGRIYSMRNFVTDALAVFIIAFAAASAYTLTFSVLPRHSKTTVETIRAAAPGPTVIATASATAQTGPASREESANKLDVAAIPDVTVAPMAAPATNGSDPKGASDDGAALHSAERQVAVDNFIKELFGSLDQAKTTAAIEPATSGRAIDQPDRNKPQLAGSELSALENDSDVLKTSPSEITPSDEVRHMKPVVTAPHRREQVAAATRPLPDRAPFRQASLENRNASTCVEFQSCSSRAAPLLGVGF